MIRQPSFDEIQKKLSEVIMGKITREDIANWAYYFIEHDEQVEINDFEAWDYLVSICPISEKIYHDHADYLYSIDYIKDWIENPFSS